MFCKGKCEEGNILVETTGDSEQRGRYSIRYVGSVLSVYLYVSITKLTKSDAGRYQCGLDRSVLFPGSHQDFEIRVKDAPTSSKPEVTPRPFPTSASTLTTTKGLFVSQQGQTASDGHGVVLYVRLTLVVMFIVLSASVLIFCWKRARKPRETADEAEYVNVTESVRRSERRTEAADLLL
ncbi:CMRF35-like molecule 8 isoform X3 [Trematomus bernacchii]|uniref:CMRF35-like molecule 8 isoform X3 n=1 Tax=Trematomus bernacchii TaxID=40690 RepID=UPI00146E8533|nr:CMRF35-like molecule 8 isoform X3 [Trematomus bernacchii]